MATSKRVMKIAEKQAKNKKASKADKKMKKFEVTIIRKNEPQNEPQKVFIEATDAQEATNGIREIIESCKILFSSAADIKGFIVHGEAVELGNEKV